MRPAERTTEGQRQRWLYALLLAGLVGVFTGMTVFASFSTTASNEGNLVTAGTVVLGSNAAEAPLYDVAGQLPGATIERCVRVMYTGSLPADLRLYASAVGTAGSHVDLMITAGQGTPVFPGCGGFTADPGGQLYAGTLGEFAATHRRWSNGLALPPPSAAGWQPGGVRVYRLELTGRDGEAAAGLSTGPHTYTWEARSR